MQINKNLKHKKAIIVLVLFVVFGIAAGLGIYFGLSNNKGYHTTPTTTSSSKPTTPTTTSSSKPTTYPTTTPTSTNTEPIPTFASDIIVEYINATLSHNYDAPQKPICKNNNFDTYTVKYSSRNLISYKNNDFYPKQRVYLSKNKQLWFIYNKSNGLFELYSSGSKVTEFAGKIIAIMYNNLYVYLPLNQLPEKIKSLLIYKMQYDYYKLTINEPYGVTLYGIGNVDVINNQICMNSYPKMFDLEMYNPTITTNNK